MYNDSSEEWWAPFQSHWLTDDKEWMVNRRKFWKMISKNVKSNKDALGLKGLRNMFTTGYLLSEPPPQPDLDGIVKNMRVSPSEKLYLAPFTAKSDYQEYANAVHISHGDRGLAEILKPFYGLSRCLKGTDLLQSKIDQIYQHILGGGAVSDNEFLFRNERVLQLYDIPIRLNEYFGLVSELLQLTEKVEKEEYRALESLFGYFTSMADYLTEHEEQNTKAMERLQHFPVNFEDFKNPCPLKDEPSKVLYDKSREFIFGGRLPKAMRIT